MGKVKNKTAKGQNGVNKPAAVIVTDMKKTNISVAKRANKETRIVTKSKTSGHPVQLRTPAPFTYKDKQTEITGMDNNPHLIAWVYIRLISKIILPGGAVAALITAYKIFSG